MTVPSVTGLPLIVLVSLLGGLAAEALRTLPVWVNRDIDGREVVASFALAATSAAAPLLGYSETQPIFQTLAAGASFPLVLSALLNVGPQQPRAGRGSTGNLPSGTHSGGPLAGPGRPQRDDPRSLRDYLSGRF